MKLAVVAMLLVVAAARAGERELDPGVLTYTYGVGGFVPEYVAPPPGSYALPPIATIQIGRAHV